MAFSAQAYCCTRIAEVLAAYACKFGTDWIPSTLGSQDVTAEAIRQKVRFQRASVPAPVSAKSPSADLTSIGSHVSSHADAGP